MAKTASLFPQHLLHPAGSARLVRFFLSLPFPSPPHQRPNNSTHPPPQQTPRGSAGIPHSTRRGMGVVKGGFRFGEEMY